MAQVCPFVCPLMYFVFQPDGRSEGAIGGRWSEAGKVRERWGKVGMKRCEVGQVGERWGNM